MVGQLTLKYIGGGLRGRIGRGGSTAQHTTPAAAGNVSSGHRYNWGGGGGGRGGTRGQRGPWVKRSRRGYNGGY
jgi:hypothetical protein